MPKNGYLYSNEPVVEKIVMFGHGNFGNAKMCVLGVRVVAISKRLAQLVGWKIERCFEGITYDYYFEGKCFLAKKLMFFLTPIPMANLSITYSSYKSLSIIQLELWWNQITICFAGCLSILIILAKLVQNNESLVDTPPAALIGNLKNITNLKEIIACFVW